MDWDAGFGATAFSTQDELLRPPARKLVNVSQVPQLSPFRYPGGKTWCMPELRHWLASLPELPKTFVEPFGGGAIASLTVAAGKLAERVIVVELDADVAAVWQIILGREEVGFDRLCREVLTFKVSRENVVERLARPVTSLTERAFRTIIRNRVNRGGILAPGASLQKNGENGKGIGSRWYPETLVRRFKLIRAMRGHIEFIAGDAFEVIERYARQKSAAFFIDPPYTAGGKRAGSRLYIHNEIDHTRLFDSMACGSAQFLMTYDDAPEVVMMAQERRYRITRVPMKSTHHAVHHELLITRV